ncbi:HD-GYP domain-containing protein [Fusibacter sp. 3D3]|uniref:HD-GYP domain-containing protein n=1 Tax=Fusibacter sp. 3D3 TaxID=1048380 RepID=UPI0008537BE1|nr:HD-GYP domain-containing protein [Fusibacter sp. 3D3]
MKFKSIRGRLTFYIVIVILIVTSLRIGMIYFVKSQNMIAEMTNNINALVDIGSSAVKRPLWDFDIGNIEDIAGTLILDINVAEVAIKDQNGTVIVQKTKLYAEQTKTFLSRSRQIFFNDQYIGDITISFTDQFYKQQKYEAILYEIFLGFLEISVLGWIVLWLSSMITKPLLNLAQVADNIASGNLDNQLRINTTDEIGTLENTILSMQNQLKAHINEIELNHDEIQALYEETTAMNEELENLVSTLDQNYQETIMALANAIEASDSYTRGHCDRVQKYAILIADKIGMSVRDKRNLHMAAILHDIGKIGVPMEILNKETPLTADEFDYIKRHSDIGYQIMKDIEFLSESAQIVLQHHERYDGKGYNNGVSGESILLSARIIGIADAYDAMTSSRAYRKTPLTRQQAIDEIILGKGTQFDSKLVEAFLEVLTFEQ